MNPLSDVLPVFLIGPSLFQPSIRNLDINYYAPSNKPFDKIENNLISFVLVYGVYPDVIFPNIVTVR